MIIQNYLLYIPATFLFNMYLIYYKNKEIISDIFIIFLKVSITTVLVIISFILCMNILGLFFFIYFGFALFFLCCADRLLEICSILISCVHISYFIWDLISKDKANSSEVKADEGKVSQDTNNNNSDNNLDRSNISDNNLDRSNISDNNLDRSNISDNNLDRSNISDNNLDRSNTGEHSNISEHSNTSEHSINTGDLSSIYAVQSQDKLIEKRSFFRILEIYFRSYYESKLSNILLSNIVRCDVEQSILRRSFSHIYSKIYILGPCLVFLCLLFHIQTFIFIHYYPSNILEKILIYAGYFLLINIYTSLCIRIFKFIIIADKNIIIDISYKNVIISLMNNVYIFDDYISNNINPILILVGYYYMLFVNRICSYYSDHDFLRYSVLFYSNTIMFSWIMTCISFSVIEMSSNC
jgi:hypothetical protein